MVPIDSPLVFSGFNGDTLRDFSSIFQQMGLHAVQGGGRHADEREQAGGRLGARAEPGG